MRWAPARWAGVLLLSGCLATPTTAPSTVRVAHLPPTPKDVIEAVLASAQVPLSDPSCKGFGTEPTDATIGRYLAGYLAELSNREARNAITTSVEPGTEGGRPVYRSRFMVRHADGNDIWSWGVEFAVEQTSGLVVPGSFRCLGAG